jgi:hypothetical protein
MQTELVTVKIQLEGSPFRILMEILIMVVIAHEYGHGISTRLQEVK